MIVKNYISVMITLFVNIKLIKINKELFPMTQREIFGTALLGLVIGLANGGGIGGG